jgi:peptide deformylase
LRQRSRRIGLVDDEVRRIAQGMQDATIDWEASRQHEAGVALAAIQVDQLLRIVVIRRDFDDKKNHEFDVYINPEITKYEGEQKADYEGCLSVPDIYGVVPRYDKVRVKALDLDGRPFRVTAEGFLARVLQHEIDHTNGKLFIDHIKDEPEAFYQITKDGKIEPLDYASQVANNAKLWG